MLGSPDQIVGRNTLFTSRAFGTVSPVEIRICNFSYQYLLTFNENFVQHLNTSGFNRGMYFGFGMFKSFKSLDSSGLTYKNPLYNTVYHLLKNTSRLENTCSLYTVRN